MSHKVIIDGGVIRKHVKRDGVKHAVLADTHSYNLFLIPDNSYVEGQALRFEGQILEVERSTGYIRLNGWPVPPLDYDT